MLCKLYLCTILPSGKIRNHKVDNKLYYIAIDGTIDFTVVYRDITYRLVCNFV